jgi:peptidoglycan hydrolase-like protein with peptidoglycan-binding domain
MALTSTRFVNEQALQRIEAGQDVLKRGSSGRHVHLLQMALIDLGFAMPISTGSQDFSPDGVYGFETESVVQQFQRRNPPLSPDGQIGQETIRAIDKQIGGVKHRVNVHFRSLALSDVPFERILSSAQAAYGQYGIEIFFASGESLGLSADEESRFNVVGQNCDWNLDSGEFADLQALGTPVPASDVKLFIVNKFQETNVLGCGGHATGKPACAVTHDCSRWDPAHEIGHVMLTSTFSPVHSGSPRNLMFAFSSNGGTPLALTEKQLARMRVSPVCHAV